MPFGQYSPSDNTTIGIGHIPHPRLQPAPSCGGQVAGEPSFLPFLAAFAAKNGLKILFPSLWEGLGVGVFKPVRY